MASTYSTSLKLQLMATGENTGTWGTVTNTNLGTALEEAITGSVNVTFSSADVTLSLTNTNAAQTARNMRLVLTGTSGGARQLVVPAVEKIYIVQNNLADACTVKVSGQTGVAVPAGKTMWLCNDGTDVKDVVTHLSSLTLASPLPVASGGTGASNAATARTNLGLGSIATQNENAVSITGGTITGITDLAIADGGTGASDAGTARTNLGLGTIATQNANNVSITGGTITGSYGLTASNVSGTVAVANGGTGATSASIARDNLLVPSRDGTGAFGTWGINVSGSAASLNALRSVTLNTAATSNLVLWNGSTNLDITVTDLNATFLTSGTIPRPRFQSGSVINTDFASNSSPATFNGGTYTLIPIDDTPPQNTEGAQVLSYNYACTMADSILTIDVVVNMASASSSRILTAALFSSVSNNAIGATAVWEASNNFMQTLVFSARVSPGTTSSRTYTVRISDNGGSTIYLNSSNGTGLFLGRLISFMRFTETRP